jgi:iron(III) transport system ATP-binding protein
MEKLRLENITKSFGAEKVLEDISFTIENNDLVALLGESGSGKSTLLRIIAGFEKLDSGKVSISNQLVAEKGYSAKPESRNVGFIFQDYALFPHLTVEQNISFGMVKSSPEEKEKLERLILNFELQDVKSKKPSQISGGQQQRVAIARALAVNPVLLLLDEPFSNLDQSLRLKIRAEIKRVKEEFNTPMLLVTHDPDDAMELADKIAILQEGKIVQLDTPLNLYKNPLNEYVANLFGPNFLFENRFLRPENIDLSGKDFIGSVEGLEFSARGYLLKIKYKDLILWSQVSGAKTYNLGSRISFSIND